jgi:hypothetical protein
MRNDYYRAVLLGVIVGMGFLSLFMVINPGEDVKKPQPEKPKSNFEVVDTYDGRCNVVRWHYNMLSDYKYFFDCRTLEQPAHKTSQGA